MNIFSYIDKYGNSPFTTTPFNEIDNVIFSALSYIDLDKYVSHNTSNKKTIEEVGNNYYNEHSPKEKNLLAMKGALKILRYIKDTIRYKDLLLYNYCYIGDSTQQFSAITIEINPQTVYISFEGTDGLISGWKEDFMMAYIFPVSSQRKAINYVNKRFLFTRKKIILGGHSKGGNLALSAGMYANYFVQKKIINIYNNDGPGLINKQYNSKKYELIKPKLIHIVPNYSVFGLILRHDKNYIIVHSTKKSIYAHDLVTWVVDDNHFKRSTLSNFSKLIEQSFLNWLNKYNYEDREKFVTSLFNIFEELKIENLTDIHNNKKVIFDIIMKSKDIDTHTKNMLKDFIHVIFTDFKEEKLDEISKLIGFKSNA